MTSKESYYEIRLIAAAIHYVDALKIKQRLETILQEQGIVPEDHIEIWEKL